MFLPPNRDLQRPLFLQLSDHIIRRIRRGELRPGSRLPGTRRLAEELRLNRNTVVAAYDDAVEQGYLIGRGGSGMYVAEYLPEFARQLASPTEPTSSPAFVYDATSATRHAPARSGMLRLTEGSPDVRLSDLGSLYAGARQLLRRPAGRYLLRYGDGRGDHQLRKALAAHLGASRGIVTSPDRLLITRGSQHAFQLACELLFHDGGLLATAELTYEPLLRTLERTRGERLVLPLDEHGLIVTALADHPRLQEVRAVYVTPHHQYPTTVTLPPERRLALLELARKHRFAVIEDDYDYDFHYERPPRLPLASLDDGGHVLYIGSFTKILAPNFRVGYLHAPPGFIAAALGLRLLADRQGDLLLERALAHYLRDGELDRHLRRVRPVYRARRDRLIALLHTHFGDQIRFETPTGGMAIWVKFRLPVDYEDIEYRAGLAGVALAEHPKAWREVGGIRLGFASLDIEELAVAVKVLADIC